MTTLSGIITPTNIITADNTLTLTNKTISADNNTLSGIAASSFVLSNASGNIDGAAAQKAIPAGDVVGTSDNQVLTNKTLNGSNNTITNVSLSTGVTGALPVVNGGTGLTSTPSNGQLDIGNGTGFTRAAITQGTGITVTNGAGSITIANAGVTSAVAGTGVSVSAGTGAVTVSIGQAVSTGSNVQFNSLGVGTAASGTAGEIRATNNVTAYYSDDRLKTKLGDIENALDKVCSLTGFYYEANETAQALGYEPVREIGVSAQAVQKILPEIVAPAPIDDQYLTVRYEKLTPLLIEAIKELRAEVKALKGE